MDIIDIDVWYKDTLLFYYKITAHRSLSQMCLFNTVVFFTV